MLKSMPNLGKKWTKAFAKHLITTEEKLWIISMFDSRRTDNRMQWIEEMLWNYRKCKEKGATETLTDLEKRLKAPKRAKIHV